MSYDHLTDEQLALACVRSGESSAVRDEAAAMVEMRKRHGRYGLPLQADILDLWSRQASAGEILQHMRATKVVKNTGATQ